MQRRFSLADLLNFWEPTGAWDEYRGLAYGEGPRQTLDVYRPRHATRAPVLVFFYGGSWQSGSRDLYRFVGASLAAQGIVSAIPARRTRVCCQSSKKYDGLENPPKPGE
jgi:acetyl esterase/lipase